MKQLINNFPIEVQPDLLSIIDNAGILRAEQSERICRSLSISIEMLMVRLLPLAATFSKSEISSYKVGAVTLGVGVNSNGMSDLYLGSNIEFNALYFSVHAEQSAVSNAWLDGQKGIRAIAVSGAPCGHCRQFLKEVVGNNALQIILPAESASDAFEINDGIATIDLSALLPSAFGPLDLGCEQLLMEPRLNLEQLELTSKSNSVIVNKALAAANHSYAPYSLNHAGCALEINTGEIFSGQYAENAAHNPSLSAFSSALAKTVLSNSEFDYENIKRLVLVENTTRVSQKNNTSELLRACNRNIELEYYIAVNNL